MQEDIYRCEEELRSREASLKIREEAVNRKEDELRQAQRTLDIKTSKIRDGMEDSMENDEAQWTIDDIHRVRSEPVSCPSFIHAQHVETRCGQKRLQYPNTTTTSIQHFTRVVRNL